MPLDSLQLENELDKEVEVNQHSPSPRPEQMLDCIEKDIQVTQKQIRIEAEKMDDRKGLARLSFSF